MRAKKARQIHRKYGVKHVRLAQIPRESSPSSPLRLHWDEKGSRVPGKIRLTIPWRP